MEVHNEAILTKLMNDCLGVKPTGNNSANVEQESIDDFIRLFADYFYSFLTVDVDKRDRNIEFKYNSTTKYFLFGINCINEGVDAGALEAVLPFMADRLIKNNTLSAQETLEIKLLEKLILIMQQFDVKCFSCFINQLCSPNIYSDIKRKFKEKWN